MPLRVASYNIHRCYGRDKHHDPERIRHVLRKLNADIVALQEVEVLHDDPGLLDYFCEDSQWQGIPGLTMTYENAQYGNAILTSLPVIDIDRINLAYPDREPRGALRLVMQYQESKIECIATHLGLKSSERQAQVKILLDVINNSDIEQKLLMGDFNEWFPWGKPLRSLQNYFGKQKSGAASYPSNFPLLSLDRIWSKPYSRLNHVEVTKNKLTEVASDHLPLVATIA